MSRSRTRVLASAAAALTCLSAAPALAGPGVTDSPDSAVVATSIPAGGTRQLALLDIAGQPLTTLDLRPGVPSPFRVRVQDTGVNQLTSANSTFDVKAVLNNLYKDGTATADFIPSSDVQLSFPAGGATDAAGSLVAVPRVLVGGTLEGCTSVFATLGSLLSGLSILSGAGLNLCNALGGNGLTVPGTEVLSTAPQTVTELLDVPFVLGGQQSGAFTIADHSSGIGAGDTDRAPVGAATSLLMLTGAPEVSSTLTTQLAGVTGALSTLPVTSPTGTDAKTKVSDVVGKFLATPALASLGTALAGLSETQAAGVLNLLTGTVQSIGLGDITSVAGTYNAFPVLTATPSATPAQGNYSGTMTVTLVQR